MAESYSEDPEINRVLQDCDRDFEVIRNESRFRLAAFALTAVGALSGGFINAEMAKYLFTKPMDRPAGSSSGE
jgi:hypothetical protein